MSSSSVVRALRILQLLARETQPLTLTQVADQLEMPKATAHGILRDLLSEHFVEVSAGMAYSIGLRCFEVGSARLREGSDAPLVAPELARLTQKLGVTSHYAVLDGFDAVYICKEDPPGLGVRLASQVGARLPSHLTAVGRACLAHLDGERLIEHVNLTVKGLRRRPMTGSELSLVLEETRQRGYAIDDGETASGIRCVAAPLFDIRGCRGAIGVSYLSAATAEDDPVPGEVLAAARRATKTFGGGLA